jgi:uncharacterized protein YdhG (YjbR/CyaY superfamily)
MDAYLSRLPAAQRSALEHLRGLIAETASDAEEGHSYGMPAFRYRGRPLVGFQAARDHLGFYPMSPTLIEAHAAELAAFSTSKGTIRFTPERPLPDALVRAIIEERLAELGGPAVR